MKFTNIYDLPSGIVNAIENDEYTIGKADYSVSNLNTPPQIRRLMQIYNDEIVLDVADELWKILGKGVHLIIEEADKKARLQKLAEDGDDGKIIVPKGFLTGMESKPLQHLTEERYYMNVGGKVVSGQMDKFNIDTGYIDDYKVTTTYKVLKGNHEDYHWQQNIYNLLLLSNGIKPKGARIQALLKDHKKADYEKYGGDYPPKPFKTIEINLIDPMETLEYVIHRIRLHESVANLVDPKKIAQTQPCSNEDRWAGATQYIVKKTGGSRAVPNGRFLDKKEALTLAIEKGEGYEVETQHGKNKRCEDWCAVKQWCHQYNYELKPQVETPDENLVSDPIFPLELEKALEASEEDHIKAKVEEIKTIREKYGASQNVVNMLIETKGLKDYVKYVDVEDGVHKVTDKEVEEVIQDVKVEELSDFEKAMTLTDNVIVVPTKEEAKSEEQQSYDDIFEGLL